MPVTGELEVKTLSGWGYKWNFVVILILKSSHFSSRTLTFLVQD